MKIYELTDNLEYKKGMYSEYQEKIDNNTYKVTFYSTDPAIVYENVAHALTAKYINKACWITKIITRFEYTGYRVFYVYYDHGKGRSVYRIKSN